MNFLKNNEYFEQKGTVDIHEAGYRKFPLAPIRVLDPGLCTLEPPLSPRHAKRPDHATIGCGNIFRLRKDKDWTTVEFVETINLVS